MITHATGDAEPLQAAVNAAVDYVRSFAVHLAAGKRRSRSPRQRRES
jgi:hypothetical protein